MDLRLALPQGRKITFAVKIGPRQCVSFSEAGVNKVIKSRNRICNNGGAQVLAAG